MPALGMAREYRSPAPRVAYNAAVEPQPPEARALVLVDHGSRSPAANAQLEEAAALLRARLPGRMVRCAHLELAAPSLPQAIDGCAAEGARQVTIALWFLSAGRHGAGDIPRLAAEARARHPHIAIQVAAPLGAHPGLIEALLTRIAECESKPA